MPGSSPGPSILNPKVYEALRRQGMSKARAARISNAQAHKDVSAAPAATGYAHGPGGLLSQPGLGGGPSTISGQRKRAARLAKRVRTKAWSDAARAAALETRRRNAGMSSGLPDADARNLVNARRDAAQLRKVPKQPKIAPPKHGGGGKGGAKKPKAPKKVALTSEQKRAARLAARTQARADTLSKLNIAPDGQQALDALRNGEQPDPQAIARGGFVQAGLVTQAADGSYHMTPAGRAALSAADAGDAGKVGDTIASAQARAAAAAAKLPKPPKGGGGGGGKKTPTPEEKRRQQQQQRAQTAAETAPQVGLAPADVDTLRQAAETGGAQSVALAKRGLINTDGQATDAGRQALNALERGDVRGYQSAIQNARGTLDRAQARADRQQQQAARDTQRASDRQTRENRQTTLDAQRARDRAERIAQRRERATPRPHSYVVHKAHAMSRDEEKAMFAAMGRAGTLRGRTGAAAGGGPARKPTPAETQTHAAIPAKVKPGTTVGDTTNSEKAGNSGDYLVVEDASKPSTWHLQVKRNGKPDHGLMGASWAALHSGFRGNIYQGPNKTEALAKLRALYAREKMDVPATKAAAFAVFKDASGRYRWVMISSNAFRDRDHEIVSTKALDADVARADHDKRYGPLRWWHVGVPFGPGLDLGDCDFNAMVGKMLIESGTFRSPAIGAAIAAKAADLQGSIGFTHPFDEPDRDGVFWHIRRFERSLVPRGKAANPFTQLYVQEIPMDETKIKELATLLNIPIEQVQSLVSATQTKEQRIAASGVAYKDDMGVTEDALPPDAEDAADGGADEASEPDGDENMLTEAECSHIADMVVAKLGPMLDLEKKMAGHANDIKTAMGGMLGQHTAQKDAKDAELTAQIAQLTQRLKELEGDQPKAAKGYRASLDTATVTTKPNPEPSADPLNTFVNDFILGGQPRP